MHGSTPRRFSESDRMRISQGRTLSAKRPAVSPVIGPRIPKRGDGRRKRQYRGVNSPLGSFGGRMRISYTCLFEALHQGHKPKKKEGCVAFGNYDSVGSKTVTVHLPRTMNVQEGMQCKEGIDSWGWDIDDASRNDIN